QAQASARAVDAAFESMLQSNRDAALQLCECTPSAVTDVTGFGLLGHLLEMVDTEQTGIGAQINVAQLPLLTGALALSQRGVQSTLFPHLQPLLHRCEIVDSIDQGRLDLLLDPQTSGGLLIALPAAQVQQFMDGVTGEAAIIGKIVSSNVSVTIS
ncbi:MAG: AIR synthase-related protein, partial [Pseudomonadota bacterium]